MTKKEFMEKCGVKEDGESYITQYVVYAKFPKEILTDISWKNAKRCIADLLRDSRNGMIDKVTKIIMELEK